MKSDVSRKGVWLGIAAALVLTSCSSASRNAAQPTLDSGAKASLSPSAAAASAAVKGRGEIAPGNQIKISTYEDKNLNGKFRVAYDGKLELPDDVTIDTTGLSMAAFKQRISEAYRPYFRGAPDLAVSVVDKDVYVDVEGLVQKPGQYLVRPNSTLDEVIAKAGGLQQTPGTTAFAARWVSIEQGGEAKLVRLSEYYAGARSVVPQWRGGDLVFFQSEGADATSAMAAGKHYVQVLGEVNDPGEYTYENGADFFYYLSKAGGPTQNADLDRIEIIRLDGAVKKSLPFKMKDVKSIPSIQNGDIVMLHADKPSSLIQNVTSVIGSMATSVIAAAAL